MEYLIIAILFAGAASFVGYPLFKREQPSDDARASQDSEPSILSMIEELELDYQMSNITEEEFKELDSHYRDELNQLAEPN